MDSYEIIIREADRRENLPFVFCPVHGLSRDDADHSEHTLSVAPWWSNQDSDSDK